MKRILPFALSAGMLIAASVSASAATGVTGTVNVTGTVSSKCSVLPGGGSTFTGNIDLGTLDNPNGSGTIDPTLAASTDTSPAGTKSFTVVCNTGAPAVGLSATSMSAGGSTPSAGYTNTVDYTAELDLDLSGVTSPAVFTYPTPSGPVTGTTPLSAPLASATNNVTVKVYHVNTDGGNDTSILVPGTYGTPGGGGGVITVTITP